MHDMLGFVTEILFQTQNHRGVLQLWDGSDGSDVLGHQLVRLAHVCTHTRTLMAACNMGAGMKRE